VKVKKILTFVVIVMLAFGMMVDMAGATDDNVPTKNQPETSEPATMMFFLGLSLIAIASIGRKNLVKKKY
jgi:hypothetical protein